MSASLSRRAHSTNMRSRLCLARPPSLGAPRSSLSDRTRRYRALCLYAPLRNGKALPRQRKAVVLADACHRGLGFLFSSIVHSARSTTRRGRNLISSPKINVRIRGLLTCLKRRLPARFLPMESSVRVEFIPFARPQLPPRWSSSRQHHEDRGGIVPTSVQVDFVPNHAS